MTWDNASIRVKVETMVERLSFPQKRNERAILNGITIVVYEGESLDDVMQRYETAFPHHK